MFLSVAQIVPCFQGPIFYHDKTSLWYNCICWSRSETLSGYKSSAVSHPVIIRLACSKATSYSNFFFVTRSELWVSLLGIFLYYIHSMLSFHLLTSIFVFLGSVSSLEFISSVRVMTK